MLGSINASKCKTFACGDIEGGEKAPCLKPGDKTSTAVLVRKCESEKFCTAVEFGNPSNVTEASCEPLPSKDKNITLPGDMCESKEECFGLADEVDCVEKVCVTSRPLDSICEANKTQEIVGHEWCNVGQYCDLADTKKCVNQTKSDDDDLTCDSNLQCTTGLACLATGDDLDKYTCQPFFKVEDGTNFKTDKLNENRGLFLGTEDVCASHNSILIDGDNNIRQCRRASTSNVTDVDQLKREEGNDQDCVVITYTDKENATKPVNSTETSHCGFNTDTAAWCKKQKGDKWFADVLEEVKEKSVSALVCHVMSDVQSCGQAVEGLGEELAAKWVRELMAVSGDYGYALYAHNDNCVAASVTKSYWQGKEPDFGFNFNMASISTLMVTICAIFYLF